jgi:beta-ribofuranosylaminobenzene 5'-phosphate synthase
VSVRSIRIVAPPRIHLCLISMHEGAPRINGGIGFAIDGPEARVDIAPSNDLQLNDTRPSPMPASEVDQFGSLLKAFCSERKMDRMAQIDIAGDIRTHFGMGSGTSLRLAAIEGLALLNGLRLTRTEIISASKRGGTSGVGINSYFGGGLICDLGRPSNGGDFSPSSTARADHPPLALSTITLPEWPILLCVPRRISPKTQSEEIEFFRRTTPLPETASFEASYLALFGVYAASAEGDYPAFCRSVNDIQHTAWKQAERSEYGEPLAAICEALRVGGADCVGMSSLGPMIFCFASHEKLSKLEQIAADYQCDTFRTAPANRGRQVSVDHA